MKGLILIGLGIGLFVALILGFRSFNVVDPGYRGVYVLWGQADEKELSDGFHFINPFASIIEVDIRQKKYEILDTDASSKDLQNVTTSIAINYNAIETEVVNLVKGLSYSHTAWENVLINPAVEETLKEVTAEYTAEEIIHKRAEAKAKITGSITKRLMEEGIHVVSISITDFKFNSNFNDAIEAKQIAEQKAKEAEHNLKKSTIDAQLKVVEAEADKNARIAQAEGKAREIELLAEAEKSYHKKINESVSPSSILMRAIERWNGILPKVMSDGMKMILPEEALK